AVQSAVAQCLEADGLSVFRVDARSRVSWMTDSAKTLRGSEGGGLKMAGGRLRARASEDAQRLLQAIEAACLREKRLDGARTAAPIVIDSGSPDEACVCWVLTEYSGGGAALVSINNLTFAQDR